MTVDGVYICHVSLQKLFYNLQVKFFCDKKIWFEYLMKI